MLAEALCCRVRQARQPFNNERLLSLAAAMSNTAAVSAIPSHKSRARLSPTHRTMPLANIFLSILHSMGIDTDSFSDSTGVVSDSIFRAV